MRNLILVVSFVLCAVLLSCKTEQRMRGELNLQRVKLVEIGMDTLKVREIMGQPETTWKFKGDLFYDYVLPPNSSGQLTLTFDSTRKLIFKGNIPIE